MPSRGAARGVKTRMGIGVALSIIQQGSREP